jgi:hypothetical protein
VLLYNIIQYILISLIPDIKPNKKQNKTKTNQVVEYGLVALVVPIVILFALVLSIASASAALAALTLIR